MKYFRLYTLDKNIIRASVKSQWPPCLNNGESIPVTTTRSSTLTTKFTMTTSIFKTIPTGVSSKRITSTTSSLIKTSPTTPPPPPPVPPIPTGPTPATTQPCKNTLRAVFEGFWLNSFHNFINNFNNSKVQTL